MAADDTRTVPLAAGFPAADDAAWRALVDKVLKGGDFDKRLVSRTADGIPIRPLYTRDAVPEATPLPGLAAGRWRIAQVRPETTPDALNVALAADIAGGADAATIRFAAPGQSGLPADAAALEAALAGLDLSRIRLSLAPGGAALTAAAATTAALAKHRAAPRLAALGIDPLGHFAATGSTALIAASGKAPATALPDNPHGSVMLADGRPYHEAGASEAQEIAAVLATLVTYLRWYEAARIAPAKSWPRIGIALAADADIFLTIAKLRAARLAIARVAQACHAGSSTIDIAATTSARMMARRDPWVNLLRTTAAAAAAAIGGADEIAVLPHTWALGQPDALSSRIARNAGLVLRAEAGLGRIADPAGGAWAVESLTRDLATKAWSIFQSWEARGGMLAVIDSGQVHDEIAAVAAARTADISTRRRELTGVSAFPRLGPDDVTAKPWPAAPHVIVRQGARRLEPIRLAAPFEALRDAADEAPSPPRVFLAALGPRADHEPRATWVTNLLASGGIAASLSEPITASGDAGRLFAESGASLACICGTDAAYAEIGEAVAMALKGAGATAVYLAGRPADRAAFTSAGVDTFLHAGMDVVSALRELLQRSTG